jgi:hypothetical protein
VGDEDSSGRFDYLFEPIGGETTTTGVPVIDVVDTVVVEPSSSRRWWPWLIVAAMAVATMIAELIVWWPHSVDAVPSPAATTTRPSLAPVVTTAPFVEAPPEFLPPSAPLPELTTVAQPPEPAPAPQALPQPVSQPQPAASLSPSPSTKPEARGTPVPIERAPMSVSPEPRPAFPNQHPPDNDNGGHGGGLLGRLGL